MGVLLIISNLMRRKLRTIFAVTGVALGIAAMVSLTAITQGMVQQFRRLTRDYRGDLIIQKAGVADPVFSQVDAGIADICKQWPEIDDAAPLYFTGTQHEQDYFFFIFGIPAECKLLRRHKLVAGRYYESGKPEIILGIEASRKFHKQVGDTFTIGKSDFNVVGVYQIEVHALDHACMMDLANAMQLGYAGRVTMITLDLKDPVTQQQAVIDRVKQLNNGLEAIPSAKYLDNFQQVDVLQTVSKGVSIIAVAIAAVGILNTMMMSVYERTREIGLLRAVGWSRWRVLWMIVGEGVVISLGGGLSGIVIGISGTELLLRQLDLGMITAWYSPELFEKSFGFALLVGMVGALLPAWRASQVAPVEALRYE